MVNAPWGTIQTIDPKLKIPYSMQMSIGVPRELPLGMLGQIYLPGHAEPPPVGWARYQPAVIRQTGHGLFQYQ